METKGTSFITFIVILSMRLRCINCCLQLVIISINDLFLKCTFECNHFLCYMNKKTLEMLMYSFVFLLLYTCNLYFFKEQVIESNVL